MTEFISRDRYVFARFAGKTEFVFAEELFPSFPLEHVILCKRIDLFLLMEIFFDGFDCMVEWFLALDIVTSRSRRLELSLTRA